VTGKAADPNSGDRPTLRLVSSTGPDRGPDHASDLGLEDGSDLMPDGDFDADFGDEEGIPLGELPDLDFLLVPLLTEAERQMRSIRRPLDAEMWASELLGMLELGAPDGSTLEEREAVTLNLATRLAEYAVDQASPTGLAILRTLSVIGPPESRALARAEATRMAEGGRRDRAWADKLGRPEVGRSWRFRDPEGSQESVTVVFRYGKQEHTLSVLIDHDLGGGVKDCWIGEDPDGVLAETRAALEPEGIEIEFVPAELSRDRLRAALDRPECPETEDEIEDVAMCRALLRARVERLTHPPAEARARPGTLEG
jgi:hypothetical protein